MGAFLATAAAVFGVLAAPTPGPVTIRDDADGFSVAVPAGWTQEPIPYGSKQARALMRGPDYDKTRASCYVTVDHYTAVGLSQAALNETIRRGALMHARTRAAKGGLTVQNGKVIPFADGIVATAMEGTIRFDHLLGLYKTTGRYKSLAVMIPNYSYMATCAAEQHDYPGHREAFDRIIASFKLVPVTSMGFEPK